MAAGIEWDADEEEARHRRIAERRARVEERLRLQRQQRDVDVHGTQSDDSAASASAKGKQQAAASNEVVQALVAQQGADTEAVRAGAEARSKAHRAACEAEKAALREHVAAEEEASRCENRAIDLEWEQLQSVAVPQELAAQIANASAHCARVIESKQATVGAVRALLARRDDQFVRLLRKQAEETDGLIASMHGQSEVLKAVQERELEAVEAAYMQDRSELLAAQKAELAVLLEKRSAAEADFMEQYLSACEQYENELERLRTEGLAEHGALKRKLEADVASLEVHLDSVKAIYLLNADKLDYNHRVLVERERECKEALLQQKRRITRQWEALSRLRKRHAAAEARAGVENARLSDEYRHVTAAFNHLQSKFRHFKAADLARFERVHAMKEEELGELLEQLLQAEAVISCFAQGLPLPTAEEAAGAAGSAGSAGSEAGGLQLVGRAVVLDPLAASAAVADGLPAEVVAVPAPAADSEAGQLIPAYHPSCDRAHSAEQGSADTSDDTAVLALSCLEISSSGGLAPDGLAEEELRASVDTGALSLLLDPASGQLRGDQLQHLLARLSGAAPGSGLTAEAVARSLGLQRPGTVAMLEHAFGGDGSVNAPLADTIRPRLAEVEGSEGQELSAKSGSGSIFTARQVEVGLAHLVQQYRQVHSDRPGSQSPGLPASAPSGPDSVRVQPTSRQYWQARADAVLPAAMVRAWKLLEAQAGERLAMMQGRTGLAEEVLALRKENDELKAALTEELNSPLHRELQLPPTLLLR
ncbi:hypothetical protein ABPG77_001909 [Micractinium sp. CCAP 211/92]